MKKLILPLFIASLFLLANCKTEQDLSQSGGQKVVIGYVPGFRGQPLDEKLIDAKKLTHINYAFVNVKDSLAWLTNIATDSINFRRLNYLKKDNADLRILISLGGWGWSDYFSDAVLTPGSRKKFAQSNADIVERYDLDGVDIDWEYPGFRGQDNVFRPEDRQNFTLMFKELRAALDELSEKTGKRYQLTTAVPDFKAFLDRTDMGEVATYLDYVNLMTYDFYVGAGDSVGHHSNLYPYGDATNRSGDRGVADYIAAGVPAEKLVLGIPFYGRGWVVSTTENNGLNRFADSVIRVGGYTDIKDSISQLPGFKRYWDDKAKAPYLFNEEKRQLIVYDDEESVAIKCQYVKDKGLGGVMFWQYESDPRLYLLNTIDKNF